MAHRFHARRPEHSFSVQTRSGPPGDCPHAPNSVRHRRTAADGDVAVSRQRDPRGAPDRQHVAFLRALPSVLPGRRPTGRRTRTAVLRRRPPPPASAAAADRPERLQVRPGQRRVQQRRGWVAAHADTGAQPRGPLRVPARHSPVVPAARARPARLPARVHGRRAGRGGRASAAGAGVAAARRRGAGQLPRGVPQPHVQARDGPVVVRGALRRHGRGRGQGGRRHRGERVRAAPRRRARRPGPAAAGRVCDRRRAGPGRAQQVARDAGRVCGRRVPAIPVRLAVRRGRRVRAPAAGRRPAGREVLLDRRPVRDGRAGRQGRAAADRSAAGLRDRSRSRPLLRAPPGAVRVPGRAHRRRPRAASAVRGTADALCGRQRVVRRVPEVQAAPSVPGLVERKVGPRARREAVDRNTELLTCSAAARIGTVTGRTGSGEPRFENKIRTVRHHRNVQNRTNEPKRTGFRSEILKDTSNWNLDSNKNENRNH